MREWPLGTKGERGLISEDRECTGLTFDEALDLPRKISDENLTPKQEQPALTEQPAAQQQHHTTTAQGGIGHLWIAADIAKLPELLARQNT
jgi:hypothetical protein